ISTPPATYSLPGANNPASGNVSPQRIQLVMTQGQVSNQTISITMPGSGGGGGGMGNFQDVGQFHMGDLFFSGNSGQVRRYAAASSPPFTFASSYNTGLGDFVTGIAFDSQANLYVTDWSAANVSVFDPNGNFVGRFGSGAGFPGYAHPESILFDAAGNVY